MAKDEKKADEKLSEEQREMYVANCVSCMLAVCMRNCPTCWFRIGREERVRVLTALSVENPLLLQVI